MWRCSLCVTLVLAGCGLSVVDLRGADKLAAMPTRASGVRSENEGATAVALFSPATPPADVGALEIAQTDGEYVAIADYSPVSGIVALSGPSGHTGTRHRTAFVLPDRLDALFWRLVPNVGEGMLASGPGPATGGVFAIEAVVGGDNASVSVKIDDPFTRLEGGRLVRDYTLTMDGAASTTSDLETVLPFAPNEDGHHTFSVATDYVTLTRELYERPTVERAVLKVPFAYDTAPVVVLPVFDVDLPVLERCQAFEATAIAAIEGAAKRASPSANVRPPLKKSNDCRPIGDAISWQAIYTSLGEALGPDVIPLVVFVSNAAAIDPNVASAMFYARNVGKLEVVALTVPQMDPAAGPIAEDRWTYAADPALPGKLDALVSKVVPFRRYVQPQATTPLAQSFAGVQAMRVCGVSNGELVPPLSSAPQPPPASPLGVRYEKHSDWLPAFAFGSGGATVVLELCRRFCSSRPQESWLDRGGCQ